RQRTSHVTQQRPEASPCLEQMIPLEPPSLDQPLVDDFVRIVGARFAGMGAEVEFVRAQKFGHNLIARFPGRSSERVLLLGHTDTVWPAGEIARRPFKIAGGRAFGPGVVDMEAGILLISMAIAALQKANGGLPKTVTVLLVS